ncbi:MAG: T9SS type A sorting domain-containing protein [Sphingobacteriales bacterium]|nr:T9SS type A sorting domain-containing protein [Sphingobacteriales bacterium]
MVKDAKLALEHVLNYPNPFMDQTSFWFEHNRPGDNLTVTVRIMSLSGRVVKTLRTQITAAPKRISDALIWDGLDEFGSPIGRGVYVYQISVTDSRQETARKLEKLVVLR